MQYFQPKLLIEFRLSRQDFEINQVALYPNPTNGIFNIKMDGLLPKTLELYDLKGQKIFFKNEFTNTEEKIKIDISSVPSGIYFIKIETENNTITKRIIKN